MEYGDYKEYVSAETMMGPNSLRLLKELLDRYPPNPGPEDEVLDLGCGTGLTSLVLARETGAHVIADDLWVSEADNAARFQESVSGIGSRPCARTLTSCPLNRAASPQSSASMPTIISRGARASFSRSSCRF